MIRPPLDDALAALRAMAADVPHLRVASLGWREYVRASGLDIAVAEVHGWGPSLHARDNRIAINLGPVVMSTAEETTIARRLRETVEDVAAPHVAAQRRIAECAARLGVTCPMPIPPRVTLHDLRLVAVPEQCVAVLIHQLGPRGAVEALADMLALALDSGKTRHGQRDLEVHGRVTLTISTTGPYMIPTIPLDDQGRASINGTAVRVEDMVLPETLMYAMRGRPLGDTVATGIPALDAEPVSSAYRTGDATVVHLPITATTPIGRHPGLAEGLPAIMETLG